ncbi:MAG: cation:proton antiporter [Spirochaetales bacterium]|nr:cation:proton antiporter [Spirochaetales bacterium]
MDFSHIFPAKDPVIVFSIISLVILFVPILFERIRLPGLVGFIIVGALLGEHGFNILQRDSAITLFGTVGLLYIMFASGLETDIDDFKKNTKRSLIFGLLTFIIPQGLGTLISHYILGFSWVSSLLLASMFASHTLLAYPLVSKSNISKNEAVTITVGGTIIVNFLALLVLSIIVNADGGDLNIMFWVKLTINVLLFLFIVLFVFPPACRWFFRKLNSEDGSQFVFVLSVIFGISLLAQILGIEPIIGAFFAGLILSNLISPTSKLADRLSFTGNSLFIPFFLISVGMLINVKGFGSGFTPWLVAIVMILTATLCKFLPAVIVRYAFRYTKDEGWLIFGLSNAQAAATLAAVMVGHQKGLLNDDVLNGTILMIVATVFVSTYVTDRVGRRIAVTMKENAPYDNGQNNYLINVFNPKTAEHLINLALLFSNDKANMYALSIVNDGKNIEAQKKNISDIHEHVKKYAKQLNKDVETSMRVDINIPGGIVRASKELNAGNMLIGWNGKTKATDKLFGSLSTQILQNSNGQLMICNVQKQLETIRQISVFFPNNIEKETCFNDLLRSILNIAEKRKIPMHIHCAESICQSISEVCHPDLVSIVGSKTNVERMKMIFGNLTEDNFVIVVGARKNSISWSKENDKIPKLLNNYFAKHDFVLIYPRILPDSGNVNLFESEVVT